MISVGTRVEVFSSEPSLLGEGPVWSAAEQALYWLDIGNRTLHRRCQAAEGVRSWSLPAYPGCLAEIAPGSIAIAMGEGVHRFDLAKSCAQLMCKTPNRRNGTRFNDGKVDPKGRFWAATMQNNLGAGGALIAVDRCDGALYRFDSGGSAQMLEEDLGIANTMAWSPDTKRFYFADSLKGQIFVYDFDLDSGSLHNKRLFFEASGRGVPDGSAMDIDGCLWNARWDASAVLRITPEGKVDRVIELPVSRPTSCCFGGPRLDTLYVTSAALGLPATELAKAPLSGAVFAISGMGQGMPVPVMRLN